MATPEILKTCSLPTNVAVVSSPPVFAKALVVGISVFTSGSIRTIGVTVTEVLNCKKSLENRLIPDI